MRIPPVLLLALVGALARAEEPMHDLTFFWDFAPQRFDMEGEDSFGRRMSRGGEFDHSDRAGLRYLGEEHSLHPGSGMLMGGEIAYANYDDDKLDFESLSFSGIIGGYIRPRPWWRGSIYARLGLAFDEADIPVGVFQSSGISSSVLSYGMTGIQYAAGVTSDFILGRRLMLSLTGGIQGEYASAVSWWYYYDYPDSWIRVSTYGAILSAGLGVRF